MLAHYYKSLSNIDSLLNQFDEIPMDLTNDSYSDAIIFSDRNKYQDVKASNKNWIKIKTGYINACYVLDDYISTQYPMYNTVDHFWTLILEVKSNLIINLSGNNNYLLSNKFNFDVIKQENNSIYEYNHIVKDDKIIHHVNFKRWPDKGVPKIKHLLILLNLIDKICYKNDCYKMTVHCLAGIGRTGTFILIHKILKGIEENQFYSPIDLIKQMRGTRASMVQNKSQFKFAMEFILRNDKKLSLSCSNECNEYNEYNEKIINSNNPLSLSI